MSAPPRWSSVFTAVFPVPKTEADYMLALNTYFQKGIINVLFYSQGLPTMDW